jgi:hypothetical protein
VSEHRYDRHAQRADYLRSAAGLALTAGPVLLARPAAPMMAFLGALAGLFAVYGARTWIRSATRITLDEEAISASGPHNATVRWRSLTRMKIDYYSTRRDRAKGWMQMRLEGDGATLRLDSSLDGFVEIARRAAREAADRGIALQPATRTNLAALGIGPDAPGRRTRNVE